MKNIFADAGKMVSNGDEVYGVSATIGAGSGDIKNEDKKPVPGMTIGPGL